MQIDRKLNLVIPVETEKGEVLVHSMPIGVATFRRYYREIGRTFASIHNEGLGVAAGPRVAAYLLETVSRETGTWEGEGGVEQGLMAEIRRLTNAIVPKAGGGTEIIPWQQVASNKLIDEEDVGEVENAIVFFTVAWSMWRRDVRAIMMTGAANLWGARLESSSITELQGSSQTSIAVASSGEKVTPSSIPH